MNEDETEDDTNVGKINLEGVVVDILSSNMPDVNMGAVKAANKDRTSATKENNTLRDIHGGIFDEKIHRVDKDGKPAVSAKGKLIKKSTGVRSSVVNKKNTGSARAGGVMAARMFMTLATVIGGDDFRPTQDEKNGINENILVENAFSDYFEATGKSDIPPGMALTIVIFGYVTPRFFMPKTKSRVLRFKMWVFKFFANRRLKKDKLKADKS